MKNKKIPDSAGKKNTEPVASQQEKKRQKESFLNALKFSQRVKKIH